MKQSNLYQKKPAVPLQHKTTIGVNAVPSPKRERKEIKSMAFEPLQKINFILMAIAGCVIILGFLLMLGKSSTPEAFNPDIFSTRRIVVGPTIAFIGFIFMGVAIIYRKKDQKKKEE